MSCGAPSVDFDALQSGRNHRHQCHVLRKICLLNGTLIPHSDGEHAMHAQRVARSLVVRSQFGSHQTFPIGHLHPMNVSQPTSVAAELIRLAHKSGGQVLSPCVPLVWVPTWAFSFADSWISSLVPIDELQSAGLIDEHVLLRPDLWAWPRSKNPVYQQIGTLSAEQIRSLREDAPSCPQAVARRAIASANADPRRPGQLRRCIPKCFERVLLCQFQSTFDAYKPPMSPWRAAQRVAGSVLKRQPVDAKSALAMRPTAFGEGRTDGSGLERGFHPRASRISRGHDLSLLRVLFVNRTRTKFSRSLANLPQLLQRCAQAKTREWPRGWRVLCTAHEFGAGSTEGLWGFARPRKGRTHTCCSSLLVYAAPRAQLIW